MKPVPTRTFDLPDPATVTNLMVDRLGETTLKPDTPVICLNRGRKPLLDTWDGNHVTIPPGYFRTEYGAALHFARRLIVPGTRNLEIGGYISWIAIIGSEDGRVAVDPEDACEPFTDEELSAFGERIEGLSPEGRGTLTAVKTGVARASSRHQGVGGLRPVVDTGQQASELASEMAAHVFEPPTETRDTVLAESAAAVERTADAPPQPRPMRNRR